MALHAEYKIRWKNFRGFDDTGWIAIKPLTIVLGPNNAGKTTIAAPLRLFDQTLSSRDSTTPLITTGDVIDAGGYSDLIHDHDRKNDLFLGFRFHTHRPREGRKLQKIGTYPPGAMEVTLAWDRKVDGVVLKKFSLCDIYERPMIMQSRRANGDYSLKSYEPGRLKKSERIAIQKTKPTNFLFTVGSTLYTHDSQTRGQDSARKPSIPSQAFQNYLSAVGHAFSEVRGIFQRFSYIGPIRAQPKRYYEALSEMPLSVGSRGEKAPELIRRNFGKLKKDLNRWIKAFGFGETLEVAEFPNSLFALNLVTNNRVKRISIADAGFGASQVLPLIVQSLSSERGSLCVAEQPEIHLNPRLQGVLADLLVEMANNDQRVVVETHSEHVLLRVRRLVAEKKIESEKIAIYFVDGESGRPSIRRIFLSPIGEIQDWPQGFFEGNLKEALALATAQAERRK